ncbi:MAG: phosphatase PAP2 family protein [Gemmatimonadaceae bacterium]
MTARRFVLALTLGAAAPSLVAQPADTTNVSTEPLFTSRDLWIAGAFAATTAALYPADRALASRIQREPLQENRFLEESADFFNFMGTKGSVYIGTSMYVVGRLARIERMADLGLHGTEALFLAQTLVKLVKGIAGRARPLLDIDDPRSFKLGRGFDGDHNYRSFPSGHAGMAFAAAAAVTSETSMWWPRSTWYIGPVMFGGATLVAISRMYDNQHWASDIVMGAAIGTFSGLKVVRYHHSHPNNRIDRWLLSTSIVPDGRGALLIGFSRRF